MFDQFINTQAFADAVKRIVLEAPASANRKHALDTINQVEGLDWRPDLMQRCAEFLNIHLRADGRRLIYDHPDHAPTQAPLAIDVLLTRYSEALEGIESPVLATEEAAVYLGVSVPTIKKYVHTTGRLQAIKRGHLLLFTPAMLNAFEKPAWGRPRQVSVK